MNLKTLQEVRAILESGRERYICIAALNTTDEPAGLALRAYIERELEGHYTLNNYIVEALRLSCVEGTRYPADSALVRDYAAQARLAWLDKLIQEAAPMSNDIALLTYARGLIESGQECWICWALEDAAVALGLPKPWHLTQHIELDLAGKSTLSAYLRWQGLEPTVRQMIQARLAWLDKMLDNKRKQLENVA